MKGKTIGVEGNWRPCEYKVEQYVFSYIWENTSHIKNNLPFLSVGES